MSFISVLTKPFRISDKIVRVEGNGVSGYQVARRHSIFGDFLVKDEKTMLTDEEFEKLSGDIKNYNAFWSRYAKDVTSKWGLASVPTEKGFAEWLNKKTEEAK